MAEIIEDRVKETSITTGTGNFTLAGAMLGYRNFDSVCAVNDTFHAAIVAVDANGNPSGDWEVGYYSYVATNTLQRTTVRASSNSNELVDFGAGTKHVFLDLPAYQIKTFATVSSSNPSARPYITDASLADTVFTALSFSDEFDGNTLDLSKWTAGTTLVPDNATQNFSVAGGCLNIWPSIDSGGNFFDRSIVSDEKYYQKYGYFELKAKLPVGLGLWPGFVLESDENGVFPRIDVLESYPGGGTALPWGTATNQPVNYRGNVLANTSPTDYVDSRRFGDTEATTAILSDDFHTYGVYWTPDLVQFYFDGAAWGAPITTTSETNVQQRMFFILKLWVDTVDAGTASTTDTPQGIANAYKIDYVRAWGLTSTGGTGSGGGGSGGLTIQQVADSQQAASHELTLVHHSSYPWAQAPQIIVDGPFKSRLPAWVVSELGGSGSFNYSQVPTSFNRVISWLNVERATTNAGTSNTALELRDMRIYVYSQANRTWSQIDTAARPRTDLWQISGFQHLADYDSGTMASYAVSDATNNVFRLRFPQTTINSVGEAAHFWHGYGSGDRAVTPSDWRAIMVAVDHRLVLWNSGGTDDRANAKWMVQCGIDHDFTTYSNGASGGFMGLLGYKPGAGGGQFRLVKNEWQTSYCLLPYPGVGSSFTDMVSNPPPLGFLR